MFALHRTSRMLACAALISMLATPLLAGPPTQSPRSSTLDVRLQNGRLIGQVFHSNGQPVPNTPVTFSTREHKAHIAAKTDQLGRFHVSLEKSGMYAIICQKQTLPVRVWHAEVAPPNAKSGVICVVNDTLRGQDGFMTRMGNRITPILTNPFYIGGAVAAAIAIPLAVDAMDDDEDGS